MLTCLETRGRQHDAVMGCIRRSVGCIEGFLDMFTSGIWVVKLAGKLPSLKIRDLQNEQSKAIYSEAGSTCSLHNLST